MCAFMVRPWLFVNRGLASFANWKAISSSSSELRKWSGRVNATMRYISPQTILFSIIDRPSDVNSGRSTFTSLFLTALLSSSRYQNTPTDLCGNVKLPLYRYIENSTSDEWKMISNASNVNVTYASLIGIPVVGPPSDGFSTFNIKARQFDFTCSSNEGSDRNSTEIDGMATWQLQHHNVSECKNGTDIECKITACGS
jgi:hypothetical protein